MAHYWQGKTREGLWARLLEVGGKAPGWDLLIIGGGIVGAGVLHEASSLGLNVALLEQRDFAWGTSSRSSKMIHGGLRYLASGDFRLSRDSVRERNRLLRELPGLVEPLGYIFPHYRHKFPGPIFFNLLLTIYDLFAGQWNHQYLSKPALFMMAPRIREEGLRGATRFMDAVVDDARLVLRLIQDSSLRGSVALNYVEVKDLLLAKGTTCGAVVVDRVTGQEAEVFARTVVNAAGPWTDTLRSRVGGERAIRPLRGSHLVFPFWRLPVAQTITLMHPKDRRPVFIFPWEGVTVVGTTDLDHLQDMSQEPWIAPEEVDYLLAIVEYQFPSLGISKDDILATYSGIRPVVHMKRRGRVDPSKEKREHSIWNDRGLISVGGGKLTTYRLIARDVLKRIIPNYPGSPGAKSRTGEATQEKLSEKVSVPRGLGHLALRRLRGRYGVLWRDLVRDADEEELQRIPGTNTIWAELRWAARNEGVVHLEDLLLRRTRLGIVLKEGGINLLDRIKPICLQELGWDEERWERECRAYRELWRRCYSVGE